MASVGVSPNSHSQISKRNALYKSRGLSPTFKEVLRDRCHLRIKAKRSSLINQFRNLQSNNDLRATLSKMLHEEMDVLQCNTESLMDIEGLPDIPENDEENNEDIWIIEEYEKILAEEEALYSFDWSNEVICPLCLKAVLKQEQNSQIKCTKCVQEFPTVSSLGYLKECIDTTLSYHQQDCDDVGQFAIIHDGTTNGLFLICHTCGLLSQSV